MSRWRRGASWLVAALPVLLYLPLRAQETPVPSNTAPAPAANPPPASTPARDADNVGSTASPGNTASEDKPQPDAPEERVSADNNLSFPVDI